jgi:solute carrier family 25 S-adenosylmethionine transporter 26
MECVADAPRTVAGAFFTTYEGVKTILKDHNPEYGNGRLLPQPLIHSAASATAELVSCAILTPAEVIKQNAQMVDNSKGGPRVNATLQTMKRFQSNPLALWRGYTALAGRNLPMTAIQFPMFERIRDAIKRYRNERGIRTGSIYESGWITAVSAGSAGSVAAVITTPVDVVKTRIMLAAAESAGADQGSGQSSNNSLKDATGKTVQAAKENLKEKIQNVTKPVTNKGSIQIAKEIMAESGVKGLFRGGALRGVWTLVGAGLYLGVYESSRVYLASRRGEELDEDDLM